MAFSLKFLNTLGQGARAAFHAFVNTMESSSSSNTTGSDCSSKATPNDVPQTNANPPNMAHMTNMFGAVGPEVAKFRVGQPLFYTTTQGAVVFRVKSVDQLLRENASKIVMLRRTLNATPQDWERYVMPLIYSMTQICSVVSASAENHEAFNGGLCAHNLIVALNLIDLCQRTYSINQQGGQGVDAFLQGKIERELGLKFDAIDVKSRTVVKDNSLLQQDDKFYDWSELNGQWATVYFQQAFADIIAFDQCHLQSMPLPVQLLWQSFLPPAQGKAILQEVSFDFFKTYNKTQGANTIRKEQQVTALRRERHELYESSLAVPAYTVNDVEGMLMLLPSDIKGILECWGVQESCVRNYLAEARFALLDRLGLVGGDEELEELAQARSLTIGGSDDPGCVLQHIKPGVREKFAAASQELQRDFPSLHSEQRRFLLELMCLFLAFTHDLGKLITDMAIFARNGAKYSVHRESLDEFIRRQGTPEIYVYYQPLRHSNHDSKQLQSVFLMQRQCPQCFELINHFFNLEDILSNPAHPLRLLTMEADAFSAGYRRDTLISPHYLSTLIAGQIVKAYHTTRLLHLKRTTAAQAKAQALSQTQQPSHIQAESQAQSQSPTQDSPQSQIQEKAQAPAQSSDLSLASILNSAPAPDANSITFAPDMETAPAPTPSDIPGCPDLDAAAQVRSEFTANPAHTVSATVTAATTTTTTTTASPANTMDDADTTNAANTGGNPAFAHIGNHATTTTTTTTTTNTNHAANHALQTTLEPVQNSFTLQDDVQSAALWSYGVFGGWVSALQAARVAPASNVATGALEYYPLGAWAQQANLRRWACGELQASGKPPSLAQSQNQLMANANSPRSQKLQVMSEGVNITANTANTVNHTEMSAGNCADHTTNAVQANAAHAPNATFAANASNLAHMANAAHTDNATNEAVNNVDSVQARQQAIVDLVKKYLPSGSLNRSGSFRLSIKDLRELHGTLNQPFSDMFVFNGHVLIVVSSATYMNLLISSQEYILGSLRGQSYLSKHTILQHSMLAGGSLNMFTNNVSSWHKLTVGNNVVLVQGSLFRLNSYELTEDVDPVQNESILPNAAIINSLTAALKLAISEILESVQNIKDYAQLQDEQILNLRSHLAAMHQPEATASAAPAATYAPTFAQASSQTQAMAQPQVTPQVNGEDNSANIDNKGDTQTNGQADSGECITANSEGVAAVKSEGSAEGEGKDCTLAQSANPHASSLVSVDSTAPNALAAPKAASTQGSEQNAKADDVASDSAITFTPYSDPVTKPDSNFHHETVSVVHSDAASNLVDGTSIECAVSQAQAQLQSQSQSQFQPQSQPQVTSFEQPALDDSR